MINQNAKNQKIEEQIKKSSNKRNHNHKTKENRGRRKEQRNHTTESI